MIIIIIITIGVAFNCIIVCYYQTSKFESREGFCKVQSLIFRKNNCHRLDEHQTHYAVHCMHQQRFIAIPLQKRDCGQTDWQDAN